MKRNTLNELETKNEEEIDKKISKDIKEIERYVKEYGKVPETRYYIFMTSVIISLNNKKFRESYEELNKKGVLPEELVKTAIKEFVLGGIPKNKTEEIEECYSFIITHPEFKKENVLFNLINRIDKKLYDYYERTFYRDKNYRLDICQILPINNIDFSKIY